MKFISSFESINPKFLFFSKVSFPVDEVLLKWAEPPVLRELSLPQHSSQLTSSNATYVNILIARKYYEKNYSLEDIPQERRQLVCISL